MKIILLKDVPKLGQPYEIKEVASGFARNFLLRHSLGVVANSSNLKLITDLKRTKETEGKRRQAILLEQLRVLTNTALTIQAKANTEGYLFAGIHPADIVQELRRQKQIEIQESSLPLSQPIKRVGEYPLAAKVGQETVQFKLIVVAAE